MEAPLFPDREFPEDTDRIDPRELLPVINDALPTNRSVVVGASHFAYWDFDRNSVPYPGALVRPI